jgi:gamma-glutamyltranspeptidase/glutathione hydrolase
VLAPDAGSEPQRVAAAEGGMVSTAHYAATAVGVGILERGGNAIDAAVASALALGVVEPAASGLGGQTMMLVHHAPSRRTFALDGSSHAPFRAVREAFSDLEREIRRGYRATTVPSSPAVYHYAVTTYGRLPWTDIVEPAIRLAHDGYPVSKLQYRLTNRERRNLRASSGARFFLDGGRVPRPGKLFRQPVLAKTLARLATEGVDDFYLGRIATLIEADMEANGGLIRRDDLAQIPYPIERRPVTGRIDGARIFTMPPPGAGRTLIEMLNVCQELSGAGLDPETPEGAVLLAETIRRAFLDRQDRPFDPNFYLQVPAKEMLSREYARRVARQLTRHVRTRGETTHLSVMDREGGAVALTQSIESVYGSCAATPELGFLYNNYMSAFEYDDPAHPYYLRPNASPWASVAPSILFRGKKPWLAIGSPGSDRITSSILQVLLRLRTATPFVAVDAPRLHCSLEGKVSLEAARMRSDIPAALERHGFEVDRREPYAFYMGCVQLVMSDKGNFVGVADPRRDGAAGGPPA